MLTLERPTELELQPTVPDNQVLFGPLAETALLSAGLDYYKPTMSQLAYEKHADAEVTFRMHNRGEQCLADYIDPLALQARFDQLQTRGWQASELQYLAERHNEAGERVFGDDYLAHLTANDMSRTDVLIDESGDISVETTGKWPLVTFWETVVMSEINEAYFEGYLQAHGLDPLAVYEEGDRRLSEKIAILRERPDIKIAEFGTRRHFSLRWQKHVIERLQQECPDNIVGTSNVALAQSTGLKPIGTFAHEMPMAYAGMADIADSDLASSHAEFLDDWYAQYGKDLSIALTDTFTTDFFFETFTPEQAVKWRGVRQDSGDPFAFGERLIAFYEKLGIDPKTKSVVFSDGLDMEQIVQLQDAFGDRLNVLFGWGTDLTNDLGLKALNIVMKAVHVRTADGEADTVKLSDTVGKHTGPLELVERYQQIFTPRKD